MGECKHAFPLSYHGRPTKKEIIDGLKAKAGNRADISLANRVETRWLVGRAGYELPELLELTVGQRLTLRQWLYPPFARIIIGVYCFGVWLITGFVFRGDVVDWLLGHGHANSAMGGFLSVYYFGWLAAVFV
ncbi:MAG: hypothetical protein FWD74_04130, partial [Actinomycetia bacterium]|nr:hypothetical protein [Actinomycetes bacterium]